MLDEEKSIVPSPQGPAEEPKDDRTSWWSVFDLFGAGAEMLLRAIGGMLWLAGQVVAWTVGLVLTSCS